MQWIWYSERDNHPYYQRSSADIMVISRILRYLKSNIEDGLVSEILLLGSAAGSILWSIYFAVVTISIPYPIELREGASQVMTRFFLSGSNPFVLQNQPLAMNNYGLGYNLVVAPFAALLGNTLLVHRSVTFGFILFSAGVWGRSILSIPVCIEKNGTALQSLFLSLLCHFLFRGAVRFSPIFYRYHHWEYFQYEQVCGSYVFSNETIMALLFPNPIVVQPGSVIHERTCVDWS